MKETREAGCWTKDRIVLRRDRPPEKVIITSSCSEGIKKKEKITLLAEGTGAVKTGG